MKINTQSGLKLAAITLLSVVALTGCSLSKGGKVLGTEEIKTKAESFINDNLMQGENKATVKEVVDDGDLYKVVVEISGGQQIDSYMTKDGTKFMPQAMNIEEMSKEAGNQKAQEDTASKQAKENLPKQAKPNVELFVMSHCPYGTQIEKGIIPVIEALGSKIDFSLKFCDYAMHGEVELKEQLKQTCIAKEQKDKLLPYLKCFLKSEKSDECLKEAKVDSGKMNACITKTDNEFKVMKGFADKTTWVNGRYPAFNVFAKDNEKYGVKGSPSLVVNGQEISSGRDSKSLLSTICSGFDNQPEECKKELSSTPPAPGFGEGAGSDSAAECGS